MEHQYTFDEILAIIRAQNRPESLYDETGTEAGFRRQAERYRYGDRPCTLLFRRVIGDGGFGEFVITQQWFDGDGNPVSYETYRQLMDWNK